MKKNNLLMFLFICVMLILVSACEDEPVKVEDETKPTVSLEVSSEALTGNEVSISYDVSDDTTSKENLKVELKVMVDGREITVSDNKFIPDTVGEYTVMIKVTDEAGNFTQTSKTITVKNSDNVEPTCEILIEDIFLSGRQVSFEYMVSDNVTDTSNLSVSVKVVNEESNEELEVVDNKFTPSAGNYLLTIEVVDEAGNKATTSKKFTVNDISYREDRNFDQYPAPTNEINEDQLPLIDSNASQEVLQLSDGSWSMIHGNYRLDFVKNSKNEYVLQVVNISNSDKKTIYTSADNNVMFKNETPVVVTLKGSGNTFNAGYDTVELTSYGLRASKTLNSTAGTEILVEDFYYFAEEKELGAFNVRKSVQIIKAGNDSGFTSEYGFTSCTTGGSEWFVPNVVFKTYTGSSSTYKETALGVPMIMYRNTTNGYTLSLSRYKPIVTYINNSYASLKLDNNKKSITVSYPSADAGKIYHEVNDGAQHVYDLTIRAEITESYETATPSVYNAHFNLQNQRIVNTDIDEVYSVICEDYKTFLHATEQEDELSGKKYTSYGLPWRITIEDGEFGPLTYQAGFIGQQIPSAYNMMLYGVMNNDLESLQNGVNVIDFWVEDAEFLSVAGVPHIWYDTWSDGFRAYPCFLRMAVDCMEGLLDAYLLAEAHGLVKDSWYEALEKFGKFLTTNQNEDGSYYRCYNYSGEAYKNWDDGIEEPPGNLCQSESKANTPMAIRFLGKMYELTGEKKFYNAAVAAGEYVYENLYLSGSYRGGTCDNPNAIDKEAGVFAMYAYDTLYTLTGDAKWLECLKQAAAFTMSTVLIYSYGVRPSDLKSSLPVYAGYTDGMSFIRCHYSASADNYIAYIYHELFRIYIITGEKTYLRQAEFIQQNTKSILNWDGALGYKYKSLVAEATYIRDFSYGSATDGAWVTWSSVANAEPIAKMYNNYGHADVSYFENTDIEDLRNVLESVGCGGKTHAVYENTVIEKVE